MTTKTNWIDILPAMPLYEGLPVVTTDGTRWVCLGGSEARVLGQRRDY